jgi:hypothetical protein
VSVRLASWGALVLAFAACAHPPVDARVRSWDADASVAAADARALVAEARARMDAELDPPALDWTDPRVVEGLANDCAFAPTQPRSSDEEKRDRAAGRDALSCHRVEHREQSCVNDPCHEETFADGCRDDCAGACDRCSTECVSSCGSCESQCTNDACRHACAASGATCHQSCLREVDRCTSGRCPGEGAKSYRQCREKLRETWLENSCANVCSRYWGCWRACTKRAGDDAEKALACSRTACDPDPHRTACLSACDERGGDESCRASCGAERCNMDLCPGPRDGYAPRSMLGGDAIDPLATDAGIP